MTDQDLSSPRMTRGHGLMRREMISSPEAQHRAREANEKARALEVAASGPFDARFASVAGSLLVLVAVVIMVGQGNLVGHTATGRWNSARDTGLAVLLGLAGLRLSVSPGRHPIAVGCTLLGGSALILNGMLADHATGTLVILEVGCGTFAALCALVAWKSPMRQPGP